MDCAAVNLSRSMFHRSDDSSRRAHKQQATHGEVGAEALNQATDGSHLVRMQPLRIL